MNTITAFHQTLKGKAGVKWWKMLENEKLRMEFAGD